MKEKVQEHTYCSKSGHFRIKYRLDRDSTGDLVRIRIGYPPFLDFQELESFQDEVVSPFLEELKSKSVCVVCIVKHADFVEMLPGDRKSQLDAFCTSGESPGEEGNNDR